MRSEWAVQVAQSIDEFPEGVGSGDSPLPPPPGYMVVVKNALPTPPSLVDTKTDAKRATVIQGEIWKEPKPSDSVWYSGEPQRQPKKSHEGHD